MHNRQRMIKSNELARNHFLDLGFNYVSFKPHTKRTDVVWCRESDGFETKDSIKYQTDHFGIFDGYMVRSDIGFTWFQVKTNAWAKKEDVLKACHLTKLPAIVINVTNKLKDCNGKYKIFSREYNFE